jgi:hypothetical protein
VEPVNVQGPHRLLRLLGRLRNDSLGSSLGQLLAGANLLKFLGRLLRISEGYCVQLPIFANSLCLVVVGSKSNLPQAASSVSDRLPAGLDEVPDFLCGPDLLRRLLSQSVSQAIGSPVDRGDLSAIGTMSLPSHANHACEGACEGCRARSQESLGSARKTSGDEGFADSQGACPSGQA